MPDLFGLDEHRAFHELPPASVYLLGIYLGDGCISSHARAVYRLRIVLDLRYPRLVDAVAMAIREVAPMNKLSRVERSSGYTGSDEPTYVELGSYSKSWPCRFPQHGAGKKH